MEASARRRLITGFILMALGFALGVATLWLVIK